MCVSCVSTTEAALAQVGLAAAVLKAPVHRMLAAAGVVGAPDPVRRDVRTVAFLRSLDLDPVEVLGIDAVSAADAWVPAPYVPLPAGLPIRSHSLLTAQ
jgi:hypothetical protein